MATTVAFRALDAGVGGAIACLRQYPLHPAEKVF